MAGKTPGNGTPEAAAPAPPRDYKKLATGHEGWVKFIKNRPIHGKIVGFQQRYDRAGYEYLLHLIDPCPGNKDKEEVIFEPGTVVAMNETKQLEGELRFFVETGAVVWINPQDKVAAKKGSVWRLDIRVNGEKSQLLPSAIRAERDADDAAAPPPF